MSDSIRARVARVIAGGVHALVDRIEDKAPVAVLEQSVREVEALNEEVRTELGRVSANRHLTQRQHQTLNSEHDTLDASISVALDAGKEDLVRAALARQIDIEAQLPILETSLSELRAKEGELSGYAEALMGKKREMESSILAFDESRRIAGEPGATRGTPGSTIASRLTATESSFDKTLRRQSGLAGSGSGVSLEQASQLQDLGKLVRDSKIEERMQALKAGR